ncbi:neuronal acetylcholine receptor subunit alpha-10-like, partial [Brachionus plicatilis]
MSDENEYRLINDLLKSYNMYARPTPHFSIPTNVSFDLSLSQLIDVDEKNQVMTTNCWITMFWIDNKLKWDPHEYGGLREIRLPHDKIWKPDIILYNNADTLASISQISTQLMIESNGNVTWLSTTIVKSACSINVRYFPFDQQNCSLPF